MSLAHFQPPVKTLGVVLALVSILTFVWVLWRFEQVILILGMKRLTTILVIAFALLVAFNILTLPDRRPLAARFPFQLSASAQQVGNFITGWAKSAVQAPDDFLFAYSGRRETKTMPPEFPTPSPNATPVQASGNGSNSLPVPIPTAQQNSSDFEEIPPEQPTAQEDVPRSLQIGAYVEVANTGGQSLRARAEPGTDSEILARFPAGMRLLIVDGPIISGDFTWWKVHSEQGEEGWCADRWLVITNR